MENREVVVRFLREFAHYEDAEEFVEEFPNNAAHLAKSIYRAMLEDKHVSDEFKKVMEEKWAGVLSN